MTQPPSKVLVYGGTSEGRELAQALAQAGIDVTLSVATGYGRQAARSSGANLPPERLSTAQLSEHLATTAYDCVVDATHPYAATITERLRAVCAQAGARYLRLHRPLAADPADKATHVADAQAAAQLLRQGTDRALLAIGAKELHHFTACDDFAERFYARLLPMPDSLQSALDLGFLGSHLICMQGPFDYEMNRAQLKMTGATHLVTKDSGQPGGYADKLQAAQDLGVNVIVIDRPTHEQGYQLGELLELFGVAGLPADKPAPSKAEGQGPANGGRQSSLRIVPPVAEAAADLSAAGCQGCQGCQGDVSLDTLGCQEKRPPDTPDTPAAFFPLFIDLRSRPVLIIGGGRVASRRAMTLLRFGAQLTVVAPTASDEIRQAAGQGELVWLEQQYRPGLIASLQPIFVIAATDQRGVNRLVGQEAKAHGIAVSVADAQDECSAYFPAITESDGFIAGLVSKHGDHAAVKAKAAELRELLASQAAGLSR